MSSTTELRFVLDQGIPRDAAVLLRQLGHDCQHVGEIGMAKAADGEILAWALEQNATVVTLDADFHAMLAVSGANGPSVIRIRIEKLRGPDIVSLLRNVISEFDIDLKHGALVTVKARKITVHRLPVGSFE